MGPPSLSRKNHGNDKNHENGDNYKGDKNEKHEKHDMNGENTGHRTVHEGDGDGVARGEHTSADRAWRPGPTRRRTLAGLGSLATVGATAALGAAGCAAPSSVAAGKTRMRYWHLFGGGDGVNMMAMVDAFAKSHPGIGVEATQLAWGTPYYTKLAMAGVGGRAPEVAVLHMARLPGFGPGRLLDAFDLDLLASHGVRADQFPADIWRRGRIDGKQFCVPLDTHPMVLFYNTDICKKAGLLDGSGKLRPISGADDFVAVLRAVKKATGLPAATTETLGPGAVGPWRLFSTFYSQTGGTLLSPDGKRLALDDAKALKALEYMAMLTSEGLLVRRADYAGTVGIFNGGKTGFFLNGEWEVSTFTNSGIPFSMTRIPALFGRPTAQADCHSFVLPHQEGRAGSAGNEAAHIFVAWMLGHSVDWAKGGHIPAYAPVRKDPAYLRMEPQSEYRSVIDDVVLDEPAWFTGSASESQIALAEIFSGVLTGSRSPREALAAVKSKVRALLDTPNPLGTTGGAA